MTFPTLEQLAETEGPIDISEYGLKTEGLIELISAIPFFRESELYNIEYEVPPGFVVQKSADLTDITELRESYFELVKDETDYCVILARSSHEDEEPGEFETIPVLYDPSKPEESFERFVEAVKTVRTFPSKYNAEIDPQKAVIAQKMFGEVEDVKVRTDQGEVEKRKVIGATNTGLTCLSHSRDNPKDGVINACLGLTSKLVKNPDEISIVYFRLGEYEFEGTPYLSGQISPPKNTGNDYTNDSGIYVQEEVEVFDIETKRIVPVHLVNRRMTDFHDGSSTPAGLAWNGFTIAKIAYHLSKKLKGLKVELEAASNFLPSSRGGRLSIFQLTYLPILEDVITEISEVPEERIVVNKEGFNMGSMNFSGDIILYNGLSTSDGSGEVEVKIREYDSLEKSFLFVTDSFRDDLLDDASGNNYIILGKSEFVATDLGYHGDVISNRSLHIIGAIESQLHKRTVIGDDNACFIDGSLDDVFSALTERDFGAYSDRVDIDEEHQIAVLKDVTVEAVGGQYQIYFNE